MTDEDKRDLIVTSIIFLIAFLFCFWAYWALEQRLENTTVTSATGKPAPAPLPDGTPYPIIRIGGGPGTGTIPQIRNQSNGTPSTGTVAPVTGKPGQAGVPSTTTIPVSRGLDHQCKVEAGNIFCAGANKHGQLGPQRPDGSVALPGEADEVVAGQGSTCARMKGGRVFCWGFRQGIGATNITEPREIMVPKSSKLYNGAGGTMCSVSFDKGNLDQVPGKDPGVLHCWGEGVDPERGITGRSWSDFPVEIARSKDFDDVAVGWRSVCTLTGDVVLKCYGGQPDGSHSAEGKIIARDSGFHRITAHRVSETHDMVCAYYRDGSQLCYG
jgi:hypothetical protein